MKRFPILTVCIFVCTTAVFSQSTHLTGEQIIQKMAAEYASALSYQDTGFVQETDAGHGVQVKQINNFKTFFARPGKFRFEWKMLGGDKRDWRILWSGGDEFFSLDSAGELDRESRGGKPIAYAASVSRGASHTIATLLATGVNGFRVTEMTRIALVREEKFEGENCFVIRGYHPLGFPIDLWISKKDLLLRRIRETNKDGSFQEEIRRNVKLNAAIPDYTFEFRQRKIEPKNVAMLDPTEVKASPSL